MATQTVRLDDDVKKEFDAIAQDIGITGNAAINIFVRRFVREGGFPFDVKAERVPTEAEFAAEMDRRYADVLAGNYVEHDIVEV